MSNYKKLVQERADLIAEQGTMFAAADRDARALTDDEKTRDDAINARLVVVAQDLAREERRRENERTMTPLVLPDNTSVTGASEERPFKSLAAQMVAIRAAALGQATEEQHNRLATVNYQAQQGGGESMGSIGGFLVQTEFASSIFEKAYQTGAVSSRCARQTVGAGYNGVKIPAVDEQARADGSRWGGVRAWWTSEGVGVTASHPLYRMVSLELKDLQCVVYGSNQLVEDTAAYESYLNRVVPQEFAFKIEEAIIRGTGAGQPLGIIAAPCRVLQAIVPAQANATVLYRNVYEMWSRMWAGGQGPNIMQGSGGSQSATVWLINQDVMPQLFSMSLPVGVAGSAVFLPPSGAAGSPYATLFGRSVIPVEQCSTLGTVGDIILADLSQYVLADKGGVNAASSIHVAFLTNEMTYRWTFRVDGQPLWQTALTPFQSALTQSPFVVLAGRP